MYDISKISRLQIELSTKCNASCPVCVRNRGGGPVVPELKLTEMTLADIRQFFPDTILENLKRINHCGNAGDPATCTELLEILEFFQSKSKHKLIQQVRTNGGVRGTAFWKNVGQFFTKHLPDDRNIYSSGVIFGVDGLEDTNHLHRRGVIWSKLIANIKSYASTGAWGAVEFLIFEHNKHQVDEARKLFTDMGLMFVVKNPLGFIEIDGRQMGIPVYDKEGNYEYSLWPADPPKNKNTPVLKYFDNTSKNIRFTDQDIQQSKNCSIVCKSLSEEQEIYVSSSGYFLPCCFLGAVYNIPGVEFPSKTQFNKLAEDFGLDKFDLNIRSMLDILNDKEWSNFFTESWKKESVLEGKLLFCSQTCGEESKIDNLYKAEFGSDWKYNLNKKVT